MELFTTSQGRGPETPPLGERFVATPRRACEALARAIDAGDLQAAMQCFAPDACLVSDDGRLLYGHGPIGALLGDLIRQDTRVSIDLAGVIVCGDLALAHESWRIGPGRASAHGTHPTLVLRNLVSEWKIVIAAPWGRAPTPPLRAIPMGVG
jgi:ketosteroid isomerase-like protein